MSVQSLNNGQLQLSELVISNERYIGATGYVASSSTFSSSKNGTSLVSSGAISATTFTTTAAGTSTFDDITAVGTVSCNEVVSSGAISATTFTTSTAGTSTFDDITADDIVASTIALNNGGGNIDIGVVGNVGDTTYDTLGTLTITRNVTNGQNEFDFIAINQTTEDCINFYASNTSVDSGSTASLKISPSGISAPIYSGGIGCAVSTQSVTIDSGGLTIKTVSIPNFIGSDTKTAYVIAPNTTSAYFTYTCYYLGPDGAGGTNVNVNISNTYSSTISESVTFSIIAMNFN